MEDLNRNFGLDVAAQATRYGRNCVRLGIEGRRRFWR